MASSPIITTPTSLDALPHELRDTLTLYLGEKDLRTVRFLSGYWNATAKRTLRKRKRFTFNFKNLEKLAQFNETFFNYTPVQHIAAGNFCFKLSALDTVAATVHLKIFSDNFSHTVNSLSVNLFQTPRLNVFGSRERGDTDWFDDPAKRDTVLGHVTFLLQKVRGQVQDLELLNYAGLPPCVIPEEPFPRVHTLTVAHGSAGFASRDEASVEEGAVLLLCRTVPAVRKFEFKVVHRAHGGDPSFLPNVLRTLVTVNPQVELKLSMQIEAHLVDHVDDSAMLRELMTVAVQAVDLNLTVYGGIGTLRGALNWIGAQSDWLKKLILRARADPPLGDLKLPRLRALEELEYDQWTVESLLHYDSPDYFPSLRTVTTVSSGNDFTVALPQVTALTVNCSSMTGIAALRLGKYGQALYQLPPFPNVETLTCPVEFIDLGSITQLQGLRRLKVTTTEGSTGLEDSFWRRVTHGAWVLTLEQIRAIPEPSEDEVRVRVEPNFSDLASLKEFSIVVYADAMTTVNLDALLFLSKTKRLQRLQKLELADENTSGAERGVYLTEFRKYHDSVFVSHN